MTAVALLASAIPNPRVQPQSDEVLSVVLAETVTVLQAAYQAASDFGIADANASGKQQFRGIFLEAGATGSVVPLMKRGILWGLNVSALDDDAPLYLSDTAGALDTAAGTMTVVCGRVMSLTDGTKVAYIDAQWAQIWS